MRRDSSAYMRNHTFSSAGTIGALFLALAFAAAARPATAPQGPKSSPPQASTQTQPSSEQNQDVYDPGRASEDLEVGTFYMHKGDVDAAIGRFEDAVRAQPNLGKARLLLGEAYEKKGDRDAARKCYQAYLKMFPKAPDAEKIQKKIEKLSAKTK